MIYEILTGEPFPFPALDSIEANLDLSTAISAFVREY